jgi:Flagellar regulatory protein FleQ
LTAGYVAPRRRDASVVGTKLLIVVDPREFWRTCLSSWFDNLGEEFEVAASADVRLSVRPDQLGRASAVILGIGDRGAGETWLEQQVAWLREQRPELPIVAILESDDALADEAVARLSLQV